MPIEDFIIAVFCCVEQCLPEIAAKHPLRQRGFAPQCSDSEVLTMEVVGEYLSAYTRQMSERGLLVKLDTDNWRVFAQIHRSSKPWQKVKKLLEHVAARAPSLGEWMEILPEFDYPLVDAKSAEVMKALLFDEQHGVRNRFLICDVLHDKVRCSLTIPGWEYLEQLNASAATPSSKSAGMSRIFLCHANEDKPQVREVYQRLRAEGFEPWLDEEDLLPGQLWNQEIRRALKNSDFILIFFSQTSVAKRGFVQREMKLALDAWEEVPEGQIHTIPIRLDACQIPERFKPFQWVDLFREDGFERIVRALRAGVSGRLPQERTGQATALEPRVDFTEEISSESIEQTSIYHDRMRRVVEFTLLINNNPITCAITSEALRDHFHADFRDPLPAFNNNIERIARLAGERIRQARLEGDGSVLIKSGDV